MDDPIVTPRGVGNFLKEIDLANFKLSISDGDAHRFVNESEEPASILCKS